MSRRISFGRTLVLAGAAHVLLVVLIGQRTAVGTEETHVGEPLKLVWIEPTPQAVVEPEERVPETNSAEVDKASTVTRVIAPSREGAASQGVPAGSAVVLPESAPSAPDGWTLRVTSEHGTADRRAEALAALALDGKNHFMGKRPAPEDPERIAREEGNRAAGAAMRAALHDNDVALGLGGGGPVVTALEAAVSVSAAPNVSHAVFMAFADATGTVTRIDVESTSDDPASFREIARDLLIRLQGQKVRVPAGSQGLSMRVDVSSRVLAPSGGGLGLDGPALGGHFDVSDVGARPRRVVHARILAEQIL